MHRRAVLWNTSIVVQHGISISDHYRQGTAVITITESLPPYIGSTLVRYQVSYEWHCRQGVVHGTDEVVTNASTHITRSTTEGSKPESSTPGFLPPLPLNPPHDHTMSFIWSLIPDLPCLLCPSSTQTE